MTALPDVVVVLPTYNERENLPDALSGIRIHGYRVLVVDDASPDGTGVLADELAANDDAVSVLHRTDKQGLGAAYGDGFRKALESAPEIVVQMDCDLSHDPAAIPELVTAVQDGAQLAIGSRYVPGGSIPDWSWHRRFLSRGGNAYARLMLGLPFHDATGGFRAFSADALAQLNAESAKAAGYAFQVEMGWRSHRLGHRIVEVPITFRDRTAGTSKMHAGIVIEAMMLVTRWGFDRALGRVGDPASAS